MGRWACQLVSFILGQWLGAISVCLSVCLCGAIFALGKSAGGKLFAHLEAQLSPTGLAKVSQEGGKGPNEMWRRRRPIGCQW